MSKVAPPVLKGVFPRKRLFRRLDHARKQPAIWISGPPGCGKTTLVASYLQARKIPCLWYQVDEGDSDPATFFFYLGQAAKRASPRFRKPLPLLTPEYLQGLSIFTLRYFENLSDRLKIPSVLVFDNYQEIPSESTFHEIILNGLSRISEGMNVFLVSRSEPPLDLIRLRANRQMEMLRWEDLRLTPEESIGIIRLRAQEKQTKETVSLLHKAADGWAAGLVMMLESVEKKVIEPNALGRFTPNEIIDYFGNELFNKANAETREFFLETAFLPRMTMKMAEDLTGLPNARHILETLSRTHYFTEKRFHEEPIYQYHPLFKEFLLARAKDLFSIADLCLLQKKAASILEESGHIEDAVELFCRAEDWEGLTQIILNQAQRMIAQGRYRLLEEWLNRLPKESAENNPWLQYWTGESLLPFKPSLTQFYFESAFKKFKIEGDITGLFSAWVGIIESIGSAMENFKHFDQWISTLEGLLPLFQPFPSKEIKARVISAMFHALIYRQPHHPEIETWEERALASIEDHDTINPKILTLFRLAFYRLITGDFKKAEFYLHSLKQLAYSKGALPLPILRAKLVEVIYHRFTGSHQQCLKVASDALDLARHSGIHLFDHFLLTHTIGSALNVNDMETAEDLLEKMAPEKFKPWDAWSYHQMETWRGLLQGDLKQASFHIELAFKFSKDVGAPLSMISCHSGKANLMHRLGKEREAEEELGHVFHIADQMKSKLLIFCALLIEALFALDRGDEVSAESSLRKALSLGKEERYFYTGISQPSGLARVCAKALVTGIEVEYVQELIRRLNIIPERQPFHLENWPWPLKIFTLGRFELLKEERPIRFSRKVQQKPLAMLKALMAFGGEEVREDQIVDALWPESDGDMAHRSFETTLHRLRQLMGIHDAVIRKEGCLTLDRRYCWADTWAFQHLAEEVDAAWRKMPSELFLKEAVSITQKAINLYRGAFLPKETSEPWTDSFRERLRNKFLRCVEKLGQHFETSGEWERAAECYERGLEVDDLIEEFYQHLMICFQRLGQLTKALSVYKRCEKTISAGLGVTPSQKTEAIHRSLIMSRGIGEPENRSVKT